MLRKLFDRDERQESIPYNISVGGGSQGLCDLIGFDTGYTTQYLFPIEKYFAGTFIGDLHRFRVYYGAMDYSKIYNNYVYQYGNVINPVYIRPTVTFMSSAINLSSGETDYVREMGNTGSYLDGNVVLANINYPLTNYRLYYYPNDVNRAQINGLFNVDPTGGTISTYTDNSPTLPLSGLTSLRYSIEVLDEYNQIIGTFMNDNLINFDTMIFFGSSNTIPNSSAEVRALDNTMFNSETSMFNLETGNVNRIFSIAVPYDRDLLSVLDRTAMFTDITRLFTRYEFSVEDAGGLSHDYAVYVMVNAIPYTRNHTFEIILI
jgi:hypothetical protein